MEEIQMEEYAVILFVHELRKLANWKGLLIILLISGTMWGMLRQNSELLYLAGRLNNEIHSYLLEMVQLYGLTLEPEDVEDWNFPQRFNNIRSEANPRIANNPIFAELGLYTLDDYVAWRNSSEFWSLLDARNAGNTEAGALIDEIRRELHGMETGIMGRWNQLRLLEARFGDGSVDFLRRLVSQYDRRFVARRAADRLLENGNNSLICSRTIHTVNSMAFVAGTLAVIAIFIIITPLLVTDRQRNIISLQYSSKTGRKLIWIQFAASVSISLMISVLLIAAFFIPVIRVSRIFWGASIFMLDWSILWMFDVTLGQYIFILMGMIISLSIGTACLMFILSRFSFNISTALLKAAPVGIGLGAMAILCLMMALSDNNAVFNIFGGIFIMPEVFLCVLLGMGGCFFAWSTCIREYWREL